MINKRTKRIRYKLKKVSSRNRLSVFRSNNHIYAQVIDDAKGIKDVAFDKGRYKYHGLIKILADSARTEGLNF